MYVISSNYFRKTKMRSPSFSVAVAVAVETDDATTLSLNFASKQ